MAAVDKYGLDWFDDAFGVPYRRISTPKAFTDMSLIARLMLQARGDIVFSMADADARLGAIAAFCDLSDFFSRQHLLEDQRL